MSLLSSAALAEVAQERATAHKSATPSAIDAFGSLALGAHAGTSSVGDQSTDTKGFNFKARASFLAPISGPLRVQVDTQYERSNFDSGAIYEYHQQSGLVAGHVFMKKANWLFGAFAQADVSSDNALYSAGQSERYFLGLEGQYLLGSTMLYGQAAYQRHRAGYVAGPGDYEGFSAMLQAGRLLSPDFLIAMKAAYEKLGGSDRLEGVDQSSWRVGGLAEYRLQASAVSVFLAAHHRRSDLSGALARGLKEAETRGLVGRRVRFGSADFPPSPGLDPIQPLRLVAPPANFYLRWPGRL